MFITKNDRLLTTTKILNNKGVKMKFTVNKVILDSLLTALQPFLEKKDNSQITSHILIDANDGILTLKATDSEIGLNLTSKEASISQNGFATANGKKFSEIVRSLRDDEITIELVENNILLKQKNSKYKLPTFNYEEFPKFPDYTNLPKIGLNSQELITAFKRVTPAIDTNNPKFELNGALLDIKVGGVNIVATDTKRLAITQIEEKNSEELSIIIPKKAIQEIQKIFYNDVDIFYAQTYLIIRSKEATFFTKLINGKFPDYHRILPKEFKVIQTLQKDKIVEAIKQISIISQELKMSFQKDRIIFESLSEENMEAKTEIEGTFDFEEFTIAFSSKYVLDFLSSIDSKEFTAHFNQSNMPFELNTDKFKTLVMPIFI
jgi:DNA polymerase III subunit beta